MPSKKRSKVNKNAKTSKKSKSDRNPRSISRPRTMNLLSKKSDFRPRQRASRADHEMSLTELQIMARSRGIPFGGLTRTRLVERINHYQK